MKFNSKDAGHIFLETTMPSEDASMAMLTVDDDERYIDVYLDRDQLEALRDELDRMADVMARPEKRHRFVMVVAGRTYYSEPFVSSDSPRTILDKNPPNTYTTELQAEIDGEWVTV